MKKYDEIIRLFEQTRDSADELIKFSKILMYDNYMSDNVYHSVINEVHTIIKERSDEIIDKVVDKVSDRIMAKMATVNEMSKQQKNDDCKYLKITDISGPLDHSQLRWDCLLKLPCGILQCHKCSEYEKKPE